MIRRGSGGSFRRFMRPSMAPARRALVMIINFGEFTLHTVSLVHSMRATHRWVAPRRTGGTMRRCSFGISVCVLRQSLARRRSAPRARASCTSMQANVLAAAPIRIRVDRCASKLNTGTILIFFRMLLVQLIAPRTAVARAAKRDRECPELAQRN